MISFYLKEEKADVTEASVNPTIEQNKIEVMEIGEESKNLLQEKKVSVEQNTNNDRKEPLDDIPIMANKIQEESKSTTLDEENEKCQSPETITSSIPVSRNTTL